MTVDEFFDLFLIELGNNKNLQHYYKFLGSAKKFVFRKAYFCQRLQYIMDNIGSTNQNIWDCGCGYGTTSLFLAMNGFKIYGTTLEFYFDEINKRKDFWKQYGNIDLFEVAYEDLYTSTYEKRFDAIILQDALHHLEPLAAALQIINKAIKPTGKLLVIEENGSNILQNSKLFFRRGFRKTTKYFDEKLGKIVILGDENIRGLKQWSIILEENGFKIDQNSIHPIRLFPPGFYKNDRRLIKKETALSKNSFLKKYFYFGINFCCYHHAAD